MLHSGIPICVYAAGNNAAAYSVENLPECATRKISTERPSGDRGATIEREGMKLEADALTYHRDSDSFEASGGVRFTQKDGLEILGDSAKFNLGEQSGDVSNIRFFTTREGGRGTASRLLLSGGNHLELEEASYTTCLTEKPEWELTANSIRLDSEEQQGHAEDVLLRFQGVPFLYLPYIRFPLGDNRLSGFLFPGIGTSTETGTEVRIPYYWNIAPNYDATITPRYMSKRGTMLETEFRYLGESNNGKLDVAYLDEDDLTRERRGELRWHHGANWKNGWSGNVQYAFVSDDKYLEDFGGDLANTSLTHVEQIAELAYNTDDWAFRTRMQGYKTLSGESPYHRLPQLTLNRRVLETPNQFNMLFSGELVHFQHDTNTPVGYRTDLQPGVSYPMRSESGFLVPQLVLRHTAYQLDRVDPGQEDSLTRTLPVFSLDSGLLFERDTRIAGKDLIQTLEPRLKYIYIPERNQDKLPNFDSTPITPTLAQAFEEYSFTGADRVDSANRLAASVSSRWLERDSGQELLVAGIGQAFELQTSDGAPTTSNIFAEIHGQPTRGWELGGRIEWDPRLDETRTGTARLQYHSRRGDLLRFRYRFVRQEVKNWELGGLWRVNPRWQLIGLRQYDLLNERDTETLYGFQYDSCCWAVRLVRREYLASADEEASQAIFLELNLKGLSSFGDQKRIEQMLDRGILP